MSLFDISKDDKFRRLPQPNSNDLVNNRLAHGTTQNHQAGEETSPDGLKFRERQLLAQQDGYNKAVFGFLESTNSFGLKVAKAGYDVLTTEDANLVFNSEQNVFKIVGSGTLTTATFTYGAAVVANTYSNQVFSSTVEHELGYTPAVIAFVEYNGHYFLMPYSECLAGGTGGGLSIHNVQLYIDSSILYAVSNGTAYGVYDFSTTAVPAHNIKYYLLQETAN